MTDNLLQKAVDQKSFYVYQANAFIMKCLFILVRMLRNETQHLKNGVHKNILRSWEGWSMLRIKIFLFTWRKLFFLCFILLKPLSPFFSTSFSLFHVRYKNICKRCLRDFLFSLVYFFFSLFLNFLEYHKEVFA